MKELLKDISAALAKHGASIEATQDEDGYPCFQIITKAGEWQERTYIDGDA